jgi:hypothetical protein
MDDPVSHSAKELDELFRGGAAVMPRAGLGRGTALALPGTVFGRSFAAGVRLLAWKGKQFGPGGTSLRNVLTPLSIRAIEARVGIGTSWLDDRPCVVLDYSSTSLLAKWVRDEIREISPGRYVGLVFLGRRRLPLRFALDFTPAGVEGDAAAPASEARDATAPVARAGAAPVG